MGSNSDLDAVIRLYESMGASADLGHAFRIQDEDGMLRQMLQAPHSTGGLVFAASTAGPASQYAEAARLNERVRALTAEDQALAYKEGPATQKIERRAKEYRKR